MTKTRTLDPRQSSIVNHFFLLNAHSIQPDNPQPPISTMPSFAPLRPTLGLAHAANSAARSFSSSASRSVARLILTGRLGGEPELSATATGKDIVKYSVGSSYGPRDNRQTSWFRIAAFLEEGPQRDYILSLQKG